MEIEALNPEKGSCSSGGRLDPLPCRMYRHLDSASYRTLLRIFSLRLDDEVDDDPLEPLRGARQDPVPTKGCSLTREAPESVSGGKDSILDRIGGGNLAVDRGNGSLVDLDGNSSEVLVPEDRFASGHSQNRGPEALQLGDSEVGNWPIKEVFAQRNAVCHSPHKCKSVEATQSTSAAPLGMADAQDTNETLGDKPSHIHSDAPKDQVSYLPKESDQGHDKEFGEMDHLIANQIPPSPLYKTKELTNGKLGLWNNEDMNNGLDAPDKRETIEGHDEAFDFNNGIVERIDSSGFMKLDMDLINQLLDSDGDEDIEEGQIPDEFLSSDLLVEQLDQNVHAKGQALGGSSSCDFSKEEKSEASLVNFNGINISTGYTSLTESKCKQDQLSRVFDDTDNVNAAITDERCQTVTTNASGSSAKKLVNPKSPSNNKVVEVQEKKKRKLTEERKAKKKKAKKRKRAENDRKQGVKRLKLQPVLKPKVVQYCTFYLKGRCEQGDLCKFSHDTTPLTKSVACKYFVTGSCLKGNDCPYDHNLSKYPCHLFLSNGTCIRGDKCKFSHKISESSSSAAVVVNPTPSSAAEKLSLGKQKAVSNTFTSVTEVHKGIPRNAKEDHIINISAIVCDASKSLSSSMKSSTREELPGSSIKVPKPRAIPNGISFLSFGSGPFNTIHEDKSEKICSINNCSQQNPDKFCMSRHMDNSSLTGKPLPKMEIAYGKVSGLTVLGSPGNLFEGTSLKSSIFNNVTTALLGSKSIQNEVSDASKILDEFLFGVGN